MHSPHNSTSSSISCTHATATAPAASTATGFCIAAVSTATTPPAFSGRDCWPRSSLLEAWENEAAAVAANTSSLLQPQQIELERSQQRPYQQLQHHRRREQQPDEEVPLIDDLAGLLPPSSISVSHYTEFTLQGLLLMPSKSVPSATDATAENGLQQRQQALQQLEWQLHAAAVAFSDCWSEMEWIDMNFLRERKPAAGSTDMRTSATRSKRLSLRLYTAPPHLKDKCAVRYRDEGSLATEAGVRRACNMRRVCEIISLPTIIPVLKSIGFQQVSEVFVKAQVYHSKFATHASTMLLVQKHFLDAKYTIQAVAQQHFGESSQYSTAAALVEAKARSSSTSGGAAAAAADQALAAFSRNFLPFVHLRKVEATALAKAEKELRKGKRGTVRS